MREGDALMGNFIPTPDAARSMGITDPDDPWILYINLLGVRLILWGWYRNLFGRFPEAKPINWVIPEVVELRKLIGWFCMCVGDDQPDSVDPALLRVSLHQLERLIKVMDHDPESLEPVWRNADHLKGIIQANFGGHLRFSHLLTLLEIGKHQESKYTGSPRAQPEKVSTPDKDPR